MIVDSMDTISYSIYLCTASQPEKTSKEQAKTKHPSATSQGSLSTNLIECSRYIQSPSHPEVVGIQPKEALQSSQGAETPWFLLKESLSLEHR